MFHFIKHLFFFFSMNIESLVTKIFKITLKFVRIHSFDIDNHFFSNHFLETAELQRTLQSLACGKIRLLNKKPMVNPFSSFLFLLITVIAE